jgi:large subunit ribosomal protein L21
MPKKKDNNIAVIEIKPRQFLVKKGDVLVVNSLNLKDKEIITPPVLLTSDGQETKIGQPLVKDAKVELKHIETKKGEKIRVAKFKAKSRYRRVKGHRQLETHLLVQSITI